MISLLCSLPDIATNPVTYISSDYDSGVTLSVSNTAAFNTLDYIVVGILSSPNAEIGQIAAVADSGTITLLNALEFPHPADQVVTRIDYNEYRIYKSATGVDGSYALLDTQPLPVNQQQIEYLDPNGVSPYSYEFTYFNVTTGLESEPSDQIPFDGFPIYSLRSLQDQIIDLFGDYALEFINRNMVTTWLNELTMDAQYKLTDGDSPLFINHVLITSTGAYTYDLSTYSMVSIYFIEFSTDGGQTFQNIANPAQFGYQTLLPQAGGYGWRLGGETIYFDTPIPQSYVIRIWYWSQPTLLSSGSDNIPFILRGYTPIYVNHGLRRAYEKQRLQTQAKYYGDMVDAKMLDVIPLLKQRIRAGNMEMGTTWADTYQSY